MSPPPHADDSVGPEREPISPAGATVPTITIPESTLPPVTVDTSPQIWSICLTHADKFDRALVESWKGDMDGILIFSGLFSAVVTAFLIDSYKALLPDPSLPLTSRHSRTAYLVINALWFLSLSFSLTCALAATLVQQWSRTYLQGTEERFNPHQRARMRTYLQRGVQKFYFSRLVDAIPMLLHIALFLFFAGLIVFLFIIDNTLAIIMLVLLIPAFFLYIIITALPVFYYDCPYKTPLTFVLSYLTYFAAVYYPSGRRHGRSSAFDQWHPHKQTSHLTALWAKDAAQGAELDHTALRWTLLALTEPNDIEQFVGTLPGLLQPDSGVGFTHDGTRAAQSLLFGPDMLASYLVRLLDSTVPSYASALSPADRRRLDARAVTCLSTVSLLARACEGPAQAAPELWSVWTSMYANPISRKTLALAATLRAQAQQPPDFALAALAHGTALLLAWRTLVAYRTFLADIHQRTNEAASTPMVLYATRFTSELRKRLSAGVYLALALRDVFHGLTGDPGSGVAGGALLAQQGEALLGGAIHGFMPGAPGFGRPSTGARVDNGNVESDMRELERAAQADMVGAKVCLAQLFMHAACSLPADAAGQEMLRALAAPLAWPEPCVYEEADAAMELLLTVRHAHGETVTVFDADGVVALYLSIHDPRQHRPEPSADEYMVPRRSTWRQTTF